MHRNCLVLTQYRSGSGYNDFIGKFYHFPATKSKNYLRNFAELPLEFVYYEPAKRGKGVYFGYGRITKPPFPDNREPGYYFVELEGYKPFLNPVKSKSAEGELLERASNPDHYNSGNSVRKISSDLLDALCLDGSIQLNFTADSHLIQVLGEQLIGSERVGILELVKNAFDAGATNCRVRIENVPSLAPRPRDEYEYPDRDGPVIVIEDNGSGMTRAQLEAGWLRPATTLKTDVKERLRVEREQAMASDRIGVFESLIDLLKLDNNGRIPLGEKGVGRFACHRLGRRLELTTKPRDADQEFLLSIDWDKFDVVPGSSRNLDSVKVTLTRQPPSRDYGASNSGTRLLISGGRPGFQFTESGVREINSALLQLTPPRSHTEQGVVQKFHVEFECPQVQLLSSSPGSLMSAPVFTLSGVVDEHGKLTAEYAFSPPAKVPLSGFKRILEQRDLREGDKDYWRVKDEDTGISSWRDPVCGQFSIELKVWYRDREWVNKLDGPFLEYLSKYGGIGVTRDGIAVFSADWGSETDWLHLRQRQIKKANKLSYYHMLGNIGLDQLSNFAIVDKTNREGMVQNQAFLDMRELALTIVYMIEIDYRAIRTQLQELIHGAPTNVHQFRKYSVQAAEVLTNLVSSYDVTSDPNNLFANIDELGDSAQRSGKLVRLSESLQTLEKTLKQLQEVEELLTEQAGFGLGIAVALHEITKSAANFYYGIVDLIERGKFDQDKLEELKIGTEALQSELLKLGPLRALRSEEEIPFDVMRSVDYVQSVFARRMEALGIIIEVRGDPGFPVLARFGALNQIFANLLDNSCYWLETPSTAGGRILIDVDSARRRIIVADSGPGIPDPVLQYLFQPGNSTRVPPSGLGLYICQHYMNSMRKRGDVYLAPESDRIAGYPGAQFVLDFSRVMEHD